MAKKYSSVIAVRKNNYLPEHFEHLQSFVGLCVEFLQVTILRKFRNYRRFSFLVQLASLLLTLILESIFTLHVYTAIGLCRSSDMAVKKSGASYAVCAIYIQTQAAVLEPILFETRHQKRLKTVLLENTEIP